MTIEVLLPELAEGMAAAKLTVWLKREGQPVTAGEPIAEVETEKTSVELEAPASGVLERIAVSAGTEGIPVGTVLAVIARGVASADPAALPVAPARSASNQSLVSLPQARPDLAPAPPEASHGIRSTPDTAVAASPLAMRMATLAGLDLGDLAAASGGSAITKADVNAALRQRSGSPKPVPATAIASPPSTPGSYQDLPLSGMQRVAAVRLQQAKQTIPHFYLEVDCRVDSLVELRARINEGAVKVSITDILVLIASRALATVPAANASWVEDRVRVYASVDIAVAVATPKGLIAPIVRGAERKSLATISRELADLAARARLGQLKPDEYSGGTFTISNLGMFGVTRITPIINPPQTAILGTGAIDERPVVADGRLCAGKVMSCTLAADHRALDGATGAQFLGEVRRLIENPSSLVLYL